MAGERKKFLPVQIPLINKEIELLAFKSEDLKDRFVKLDMAQELRGKNLELRLRVILEGDKPRAYPVEAYLLGSYIRRMMRKGTDYVEDSFLVQCKDHRIRIKPFLITRKRVSRSVRAALREEAKKTITEYVKNKSFDNLVLDIINNKFQKELNAKLKKIYPLGLCEIRSIGVSDSTEYVAAEEKSDSEEVEYENLEEKSEEKKPKAKKAKKKKSDEE